MIYLIQQTYFDEENNRPIKLLKIGYSDDLGNRMKSYYSQAPLTKLISSRSGGTLLESTFHKKFDKYKFPDEENKGYREWFYYNKEIIDSFQTDSDEDLLKPREDLIQLKFEDYFIKSISLRSPEKLYKEDKDNLINLLQNEIKLNPDLSEFYEEDKALELFKSNLEKYHLELTKTKDSYVRSIDFIKTLRSRNLSIEFSDSNIESLAVDISEDLPQILGRQRDTDNPWKNQATFYYKTTKDYRKVKWEEFEKLMKEKQRLTESLLKAHSEVNDVSKIDLARTYEFVAKAANYKDNYVAVNTKNGYTPVFNNLVYVNELRAFKIQQLDYQDRFAVFSTIQENTDISVTVVPELIELSHEIDAVPTFRGKLKYFCESALSKEMKLQYLNQFSESNKLKSYYTIIGPKKLKALGYKKNLIDIEYSKLIVESNSELDKVILSRFLLKSKLGLPDLKKILTDLYHQVDYKATPKATDLEKYFELKAGKMDQTQPDGTKKRIHSFELISVKPEYQELYNQIHQ